jgi:hypothetical protein
VIPAAPSSSAPRALRGEALRTALGLPARSTPEPSDQVASSGPVPSSGDAFLAPESREEDEDSAPPALRPHELALRLQREAPPR